MTIKKTATLKRPAAPAAAEGEAGVAAPAKVGATIADRFKLDTGPVDTTGYVGRKSAMFALLGGLAGLAASAVLVYLLWQHWQYLMPA